MSINDQFNMGRLPIRPLSLTEKALAQTKELIIDNLGDNPSYHIYIADAKDRTKLIDITELIIKEAFPLINADEFNISIEGLLDAQNLRDIINFIYKRFILPEDPNGFNYDEDYEKIIDPLISKTVLLKDVNENIYLPVTTADNVFDSNGTSIEDRLNNMTRVGFSTAFVKSDNYDDGYQSSFEFEYPFPDYSEGGNHIEVRIGSTFIDKSRYEILDEESSDGHVYKATLNLINERLECGRTINLLFIYNSADVSGGKNQYIYGGLIANNSIPSNKLEKVSDRYDLSDSTSIASSKAVYNLYKFCCDKLNINPETPGSGSTGGNYKLGIDRYAYTIQEDKENTISFKNLQYIYGDEHIIFVYRNGVRLFESIDYSIDVDKKEITVYVNTEKYDKFVFEYHSIEKR